MIDSRTAAYGVTVLRVTLGVAALSHGLLKLLVFGPTGTIGFFASLGLPAALAWYAMAVETLGGIALIIGFYARIAALLQLPILLGATMVHFPNGWMAESPNGGYEFPLFWAGALLAQVLLGPGALFIKDMAPLGEPVPQPRTA